MLPQFIDRCMALSPSTCDDAADEGDTREDDMNQVREVKLREVAIRLPHVTLGEDIKRARERLQLTQPQLAELVGVSDTTISNWERNVATPKSRMARLRQVLKMDEVEAGSSDHDELRYGPRLRRASDYQLLDEYMRRLNEARANAVVPTATYSPEPAPSPEGMTKGGPNRHPQPERRSQ